MSNILKDKGATFERVDRKSNPIPDKNLSTVNIGAFNSYKLVDGNRDIISLRTSKIDGTYYYSLQGDLCTASEIAIEMLRLRSRLRCDQRHLLDHLYDNIVLTAEGATDVHTFYTARELSKLIPSMLLPKKDMTESVIIAMDRILQQHGDRVRRANNMAVYLSPSPSSSIETGDRLLDLWRLRRLHTLTITPKLAQFLRLNYKLYMQVAESGEDRNFSYIMSKRQQQYSKGESKNV